MIEGDLQRNGFCILRQAISAETIRSLQYHFETAFSEDHQGVRARSSRGHVYAARNLIDSIPQVLSVWQHEPLLSFLRSQLADPATSEFAEKEILEPCSPANIQDREFGLVRALFFDKPPDRTWSLPWHKDTSIAVQDNSIKSSSFSRPTTKAGVPHFIACDEVLGQMLTLRIHLDQVTEENGPLRVLPGSHVSSTSEGDGLESAVTIYAAAGDVLAMRPLISHASGPSLSGTRLHRRILHLEFAARSTLPDGVQWRDFVRPTVVPYR